MWDDENDADFLRALEESSKMYKEVELPRILSQQCEKPPSPVAISDDDSLPGPIDEDDTDEIFLQAVNESMRMYEEVEKPKRLAHEQVRAPSPAKISDDDSLPGPSTAPDPFKRPLTPDDDGDDGKPESLYDGSEAEGFSFKAGQVWVYPTSDNFPVRTYQRDIVETSIFHNTLVSLPTGLGKTFIAAVVMYNYYMWYPKGKIIFMAPTKPLVAQQIENCINIMGIPESHTAEMTGALSSKVRAGIWKEKRVFFLTPQVVQNDLSSNICPANAVKCVVIDEAHRALGDHAYSQVIRLLNSYEVRFRVLALSATPGSDLEAVQKVVSNLMISRIELRTEDSPDIMKYTHERNLELMVVDVGPTINRIRVKFIGIAAEYAKHLQQRKLLFGNIASMAKFAVLREWESFRREGANTVDPSQINRINTDFAIVHTLLHGLELLQTYGLRLLLKHLKGVLEKRDSSANRLMVNGDLKELMEEIEGVLNPIEIDEDENEGEKKKRCIYGHPKLDRLQEVIVSHFEIFEKKNEATRAIVFCEYREGVIEICEMLKNFLPLIKPVAFMGQSTGKTSKGISQKQQLEIMEKFKLGVYNTLISTSVGEEGLDIGEVDLIICFDAKNSPIRQVQRCGRTGRKRQGRIIMLVTRGKEEQKYNQGLFKKKNVRAVLVNRDNLANHLLEESPRMLPPGVEPKYTERKVVPAAAKKPKSNQQDLRKMFAKKRGSAGSSGAGTSKPSTSGRISLGKSSCLSENEFEELQLTWTSLDCCKFNRIPERTEFWAKEPAYVESHMLSSNNIDLGTYVEFLRYPQRTHLVENSTDSKSLSHLLMWADDRRENNQAMLCGGLSSQVTSTQLWPTKAKRRGRQPALNPKVTDSPKKRGRPRKDGSIRSHFLPKEDAEVQDVEPELAPPKSKSKPQFIEDDEDNTPTTPPHKPLRVKTPSPSIECSPTKPESPIFNISSSSAPKGDVIVLNSEDDEDEDGSLNTSSPGGYAYLTSQLSRQELYRELSKALKGQIDDEEDECIVCDNLFLCKSLSNLVLEKSAKEAEKSWKDISKSLDKALTFAPMITQEILSKYKCEDESPRIVSQMPRHEFTADDHMFSGLLCGGIGDLSPPRSVTPPTRKSRPMLTIFNSTLNVDKNEDFKMDIKTPVKDELSSVWSSPKKEFGSFHHSSPAVKSDSFKMEIEDDIKDEKKEDLFVQQHFADESFDFLGLSKIDDVFGSQEIENKNEQTVQKSKGEVVKVIHEKNNPVKTNRASDNDLSSLETSRESTFANADDLSAGACTPIKGISSATEQVSPILGSQGVRKPRFARLHKKSASSQKSMENNTSSRFSRESNTGNVKPEPKSPPPAEEVTSSSQPITPPEEKNPFDINFDIFDDSLFPLSAEDNQNKSKVDDALKEAIRKKAMEVKAKRCETSFTQEMNQLCESAGLTQVMQIFDSKQMSPDLKIERADSSSSPRIARRSTSPISYSDDEFNAAAIGDGNGALAASEEDMFADCNEALVESEEDLFADCDDSIFCRVDSTVSPSTKPLPFQEPHGEASMTNEGILNTGIRNETPANNEEDNSEDDVIPNSQDNRCPSPIFKPSQAVKRPSKLSLKKKKTEAQETREPSTIKTIELSKKCPSNNIHENKSPSKELKQTDSNLQADFSFFGDEFNNSWKMSQEDKNDVAITQNSDKFENCGGSNNLGRDSKNNLKNDITGFAESARNITQYNVTGFVEDSRGSLRDSRVLHSDSVRKSRDSSPEIELELAFARLDEKQRQQKMALGASSSTPKVNKVHSSKLQKQPCTTQQKNSDVQRAGTEDRFALKKKSGLKKYFSSPPNERNKFVFHQTSTKDEGCDGPSEAKNKNSVFNLSDFCDDDLLNALLAENSPNSDNTVGNIEVDRRPDVELEPNSNVDKQINEEPIFKKKLSLGRKKSNPALGNEVPKYAPPILTEGASTKSTSDVILLSSDDESFVHGMKVKKPSLNITSSSEEGVNRRTSIDKKRKRVLESSTSSDSFIEHGGCSAPPKKQTRTEKSTGTDQKLDLSAFCDDSLLDSIIDDEKEDKKGPENYNKKRKRFEHTLSSEDDVFVKKNVAKTSSKRPVHTLSSDEDDVAVQKREKNVRKKKKQPQNTKKRNGFIVNEADESDDGLRSSSDGESTSLDELDSSFINDSQPDASQSVVDIHHEYLQAVRSPAVRGRFKIPNRMPNMDLDVYSQYPDRSELDQTYADDSFCVDNEPTQYETEMSLLEIAEARLKAERKEKRRLKKTSKSDDADQRKGTWQHLESDNSEEELQGRRKRLKRVRVLDDTLSSDEETIVGNDNKETQNVVKNMVSSKTVESNKISELERHEEENKNLDDLARLLDDDIDFSAIPDIPEDPPEKVNPQTSSNCSKFVRKTPFMMNGGPAKVNPSSSGCTWIAGGNTSSVQSLQTSSKPCVNLNEATNQTTSYDNASHVKKNIALGINASTSTKAVIPDLKTKVLIIASSRQIASSPDVLRVLRVNYQIIIVPHSVPDADFILSWRLGVTRVFASDLRDRKKLEEITKKLKLSYVKPHLIIEKDRIKSLAGFQKKGKKGGKAAAPAPSVPAPSGQSPWNGAASCANAALLRQSGVHLLFSRDFDETAGFLAKLARKESNEGHGIPQQAQSVSDEVETRLQFFTSLPSINYGFALKLLVKFSTLAEFFARCSSVRDIANTLGLDVNTARKIHNLLSEVHVNP